MTVAIAVPSVYIDTNILIHLIEGYSVFALELTELAKAIDERRLSALTSELSLAEVLVKPLATPGDPRAAVYLDLLRHGATIDVRSVDRDILIKSAEIRGRFGGKLADAIHLATALIGGCTHFLSQDQGIKLVQPIVRIDLSTWYSALPKAPTP